MVAIIKELFALGALLVFCWAVLIWVSFLF